MPLECRPFSGAEAREPAKLTQALQDCVFRDHAAEALLLTHVTLKERVKGLEEALAGVAGIPFSDAIRRDGGHLQSMIYSVDDVFFKQTMKRRRPAVLDALLTLLLDDNVLDRLIQLLVLHQSWQDSAQSASAGPKLQAQGISFSHAGLNLLDNILWAAAEICKDYLHTCNRVISAVQYESIAKPGKGVQDPPAVCIWAMLHAHL